MKKIFIFLFLSFFYTSVVSSNTFNDELYKKQMAMLKSLHNDINETKTKDNLKRLVNDKSGATTSESIVNNILKKSS